MESQNPILPSTSEAVWTAVSLVVPLILVLAMVLVARHVMHARRDGPGPTA